MKKDQNENQKNLPADEEMEVTLQVDNDGNPVEAGETVPEASVETEAQPEKESAAVISELEAKVAEYLDGWQRSRAELANYKKRTDRERDQLSYVLRGEVVLAVLPVLDDFDLAMNNLPEDLSQHEWVSGISIIYRKLQNQLAELGVTQIDALGQPFDPNLHEAVMQREVEGAESNTVVEVMRKGYMIGERVLRPSMVMVAV